MGDLESRRISVLVPTYQPARHDLLRRALDTITAQTVLPREVVLLNNNPRNTAVKEVIDAYRDDVAGRFDVVYLDRWEHGFHEARNYAFDLCRAPYIANLDDDDLWEPNYLETVIQRIEDHPETAVTVTAFDFIDLEGNTTRRFIPRDDFSFERVCMANQGYVMSNLVFHKKSLQKVGGFDASMGTSCDKGLVIDLVHAGGGYEVIKEVLVKKTIGLRTSLGWDPRTVRSSFGYYRKYANRMGPWLKLKYFRKSALKLVFQVGWQIRNLGQKV